MLKSRSKILYIYTQLHVITPFTRKKLKDIYYALLRLITANYTQSKFPFTKLKFFLISIWQFIHQSKDMLFLKKDISLFLYGESEKNGPELICRPSRFQIMRFTLTFVVRLTTTLKTKVKDQKILLHCDYKNLKMM